MLSHKSSKNLLYSMGYRLVGIPNDIEMGDLNLPEFKHNEDENEDIISLPEVW